MTNTITRLITTEEMLPDGDLILEFTIPGRAMTKKTHQRIVRIKGFNRILPSKEYCAYEDHCKPYCFAVWRDLGKEAMDFGVSVDLKIYLPNWVIGDECGYMQSIGDILEKHKIIANDKYIHWDLSGSMISDLPDKDNPRVEIKICRFRHPYETFRDDKESADLRKLLRAQNKPV